MRIMKDMHETIQGYGQPKLDINGYLGMDVMYKDGIGMCGNMAANMVDKLNAINPEYNARFVTLWEYGGYLETANIEQNAIRGDGTRINVKGNVQKIYVNEELQEETITEEDKTIIYEYDEGKTHRKRIITEKQRKETFYDENGNVKKETITFIEKQGDNEKRTIYTNGKLTRKSKLTKDYYYSVDYDENGMIKEEQRSDKESDVTTSYIDGELLNKDIIKGEKKTTIFYDENEKEESRITRKVVDVFNTFETLQKAESPRELSSEQLKKEAREEQKEYIVNHAIVAMDIPKEKLTLLIDPTNPSIGIYKNGKIEMFNETKPKEVIRDRHIMGDAYNKGFEGIIDYPIDYVKSFIEPTLSKEELEEKYGLEAQNKMLEKIEKEDKKNTFKQGLKIDKGITYDFDTNTVTIDEAERDK